MRRSLLLAGELPEILCTGCVFWDTYGGSLSGAIACASAVARLGCN